MVDLSIIKRLSLHAPAKATDVERDSHQVKIVKEVKEAVRELKETTKVLDDVCENIDRSTRDTFETLHRAGFKPEDAWNAAERMAERRYEVVGSALAKARLDPRAVLESMESLPLQLPKPVNGN